MSDLLDTFAQDLAHAAMAAHYGEADRIDDPLLRAAGEIYLAFESGHVSAPHPHASNGRLRFAVYVRPR
jgi:hypothetical protein